jgi:hypothetical protein
MSSALVDTPEPTRCRTVQSRTDRAPISELAAAVERRRLVSWWSSA